MRIAITTLGCKINQYDSAVIQSRLEEKHSFVPFDAEADCYVINTCTVTDRADWEARQLVRRAKRDESRGQGAGHRLLRPGEPGRSRARFPASISSSVSIGSTICCVSSKRRARRCAGDRGQRRQARARRAVLGTRALPGHTRAFLKIQEGCNYSCTYCIIPTARGLSRSVAPREVLEQVRQLAEGGYKEIVLTGIHLGGYGHDLQPKVDLTALVEMIAASGLIARLRLSSLDPREAPDRLLDLIARSDVVCPHLHICAQAGDDEILKGMRRNYGTAFYRELLERVRARLPEAALGSDMIVGFPGETDAQFESSLEYFASLPLTYFHVFPYSSRRGTVAAALADAVPPRVKKERARRMRELGARKKDEFCESFIGRRVAVLVEEKVEKRSGLRRGFTQNYLPVAVEAADVNREIGVYLERYSGGWLSGAIAPGESNALPPARRSWDRVEKR